MKLVTKSQSLEYVKKASDFVNNTKAPFYDVRVVVRRGVAEYLANQDGLTLYASVANLYATEKAKS